MTAPRPSVSGQRRPGAGIVLAPGKLTRLRQEKSWEREDLATATGLSVSAVTKIENRERRPRAATLAVICTALGCTPADLLPEPEPTQQTALAPAVAGRAICLRPQALSLSSKQQKAAAMKKMYPVTGRVDTISLIGDVKAEGSRSIPDFWVEAESSQEAEQIALEIVDPLDLTVTHLDISVPVNMIPAENTTGLATELENAIDVLARDDNYDDEHDALWGLVREVAQLLGVKWTNS